MTTKSRQEYISVMRSRYAPADKQERSRLLTEVTHTCGYSRKYAISLLSPIRESKKVQTKPHASPSVRGRPRRYDDPLIVVFLRRLWRESNLACGKRLHAMIPDWLPWYNRQPDVVPLPDSVLTSLQKISASTIDRLLRPYRQGCGKIGLATTKPVAILRTMIPVKTSSWQEDHPGFFEIDTVAHCGTSTHGSYAYTLHMVDVATGWTEQWALWERGQLGVVAGMKQVEADLPFPLQGIDSDNGTEFINWHFLRLFTKRPNPVPFTRGRPQHANDSAHIEQKNWCIVRQFLGYDRFDNPAVIEPLLALYRGPLRLMINVFHPSARQTEKIRIGEKIRRWHDPPKTPLKRVLDSPHLSDEEKNRIREQYADLDPFDLMRQIRVLISKIHACARCSDPNCSAHQ